MYIYIYQYVVYLKMCSKINNYLDNCTILINAYKTIVSFNDFEFVSREKSMELEKRHVV